MKEIFLSILFLVPCLTGDYLKYHNVDLDSPEPIDLSPSVTVDTYIYTEIMYKKHTIMYIIILQITHSASQMFLIALVQQIQ